MKIKVQIDSVFQEETLQIQAPSRTPKDSASRRVCREVWMITNDSKEKKMAKLISSSLMLFPESTSKIVKF